MDATFNSKMMSPEELLNQKLIDPSTSTCGLKKCFPDETSDEIVSRLQDDLLKVIGYERAEKRNSRSQAEYNAMSGLIVITRKLGKWTTFGYRTNNLDCLRNYEALYLIDTNRLELYYDSVLVSLEQAYALLLYNQHDDRSHEKYFIYSNLSKAGYIVQPHRRYIQVNTGNPPESTKDKCVWRWLLENLNQPCPSKNLCQEGEDETYLKIKQNMKNIEEAIKSQRSNPADDLSPTDVADNWQNAIVSAKRRKESSKKRKLEPTTSKKITKLEQTTDQFLDVLAYEQDVSNFRQIFDEIQVIELNRTHCSNAGASLTDSDVEFDFDLYLAQTCFKQSDPGVPNFRILIFKSTEQPPTRESIVKAFLKPAVRAPVLVFYINDLMRRTFGIKHFIRGVFKAEQNDKKLFFQKIINLLPSYGNIQSIEVSN